MLSFSASMIMSISLQLLVIFFSSVSSTLAICTLNLFAPLPMHLMTTGMILTRYPGLLPPWSHRSLACLYFCNFSLTILLMFWQIDSKSIITVNIQIGVWSCAGQILRYDNFNVSIVDPTLNEECFCAEKWVRKDTSFLKIYVNEGLSWTCWERSSKWVCTEKSISSSLWTV